MPSLLALLLALSALSLLAGAATAASAADLSPSPSPSPSPLPWGTCRSTIGMTYKANITSGGSGAEFSDALARRYTELVANSTSQWFDIVMDYYRVMADMSVSFAYAVSYGAENSAVISSNMNALSLRALRDVITEVDSTSASLAIDHRENKCYPPQGELSPSPSPSSSTSPSPSASKSSSTSPSPSVSESSSLFIPPHAHYMLLTLKEALSWA